MLYIDMIQSSIDYIEENLKTELKAEELAWNAGFSLFHYYRVFQGSVGIPIMQYVIRRKLIHAINEISCGGKMIEVALSYGFNTHAGFFKAFKREYGYSPSEYLKKNLNTKIYKTNLLQEEHIMITQKKVKEMLEKYWNLSDEKLANVYYDASGLAADDTWYVNDDYIIKVGNNLNGLKHHINISKALQKAGLKSGVPIPNKLNNDFVLEGDLYYCVMECLKGVCIKSGECYEGDYETKARYLGEIIGQLHLILQRFDEDCICNEPNMLEDSKNWAIPKMKTMMQMPEAFYMDYIDNFGILYPELPKHMIHRDPNPSNIIMVDGKLNGFIDFEFTERNVRLFDPCYAATAILSESFTENNEEKMKQWFSIYRNIILGYDSICKLSNEEKKAIPYVVYSIQMIFVAYFSDKEKYTELGSLNQKMLIWLYENRDLLNPFD